VQKLLCFNEGVVSQVIVVAALSFLEKQFLVAKKFLENG